MFLFKSKVLFFLVILVVLGTGCANSQPTTKSAIAPSAESVKQLELFSKLADNVYNKTINGDFPAARQDIIRMGEMVPQMRLDGFTSLRGIKAIADTILQASSIYNAVRLDLDAAMLSAARIRLMADALSHPNTPLWTQYGKVMDEDLRTLEQAFKQKDSNAAKQSFIDLKQHYDTVFPALQVSRDGLELLKLDTAFRFLQSELKAEPMSFANLTSALKSLREQLNYFFQYRSDTTAYIPLLETNESFIVWTFGIGLLIILGLGFTAWRMKLGKNGIISVRTKHKE
jgi:sporulation protein YpjB